VTPKTGPVVEAIVPKSISLPRAVNVTLNLAVSVEVLLFAPPATVFSGTPFVEGVLELRVISRPLFLTRTLLLVAEPVLVVTVVPTEFSAVIPLVATEATKVRDVASAPRMSAARVKVLVVPLGMIWLMVLNVAEEPVTEAEEIKNLLCLSQNKGKSSKRLCHLKEHYQ